MKYFRKAVLLIAVLCLMTVTLTAAAEETPVKADEGTGGILHEVKKGDTLWEISKNYECRMEDIMTANTFIRNPSRIYTGWVLHIPSIEDQKDETQYYSRKLMAGALYNIAGTPKAPEFQTPFDVTPDDSYAPAILWVIEQKLMTAENGNFGPEEPLLWEEAAQILYTDALARGLDVSVGENTNILSYRDFDQITEEYISAIQWACGSGLMKDRGDGMLRPKEALTLEEGEQLIAAYTQIRQ